MQVRGGWCLIRTQRLCHKILLSLRHVCDGIFRRLLLCCCCCCVIKRASRRINFVIEAEANTHFSPSTSTPTRHLHFQFCLFFHREILARKLIFISLHPSADDRAQRQMTHTRTCCCAVEAWWFGDFRALTKNTFQQPKMCSASRSDVNVFTKTKQRRSPVLRFDGIPNCHIDFWTPQCADSAMWSLRVLPLHFTYGIIDVDVSMMMTGFSFLLTRAYLLNVDC